MRKESFQIIKALTLASMLSGPSSSAEEGPSPADWNQYWKDCQQFKLPIAQLGAPLTRDLFKQGALWEKAAQKELAELRKITDVTCKKWAENPNGDEPLREFRTQFSAVSSSALNLKQVADEQLMPDLNSWYKQQAIHTAVFGFKFDDYGCGQAFRGANKRIASEIRQIEARFQELKAKCPVAADAEIAKALRKGPDPAKFGAGNGGPARAPAGQNPKHESDITGTKRNKAGERVP